jgi:hypothetical protein
MIFTTGTQIIPIVSLIHLVHAGVVNDQGRQPDRRAERGTYRTRRLVHSTGSRRPITIDGAGDP